MIRARIENLETAPATECKLYINVGGAALTVVSMPSIRVDANGSGTINRILTFLVPVPLSGSQGEENTFFYDFSNAPSGDGANFSSMAIRPAAYSK